MSLALEVTLREEICPARLQIAANKAVEFCPYVTFEIFKRGDIVYFQKNNLPLVVHSAEKLKNSGLIKTIVITSR